MAKSELPLRDLYLDIALQAARKGGEVLKKYWGKLSQIKEKTIPGNLVTEADQESEREILGILKKNFPSHDIIAEETGMHLLQKSNFCWYVDPLDGTTNYAHQYPTVNISIGLFEKGQPLVAVVFNPFYDELFYAVRGKGAFLNDEKIHVSNVASLEKSLLATGFPYDRKETNDNNYAEFCELTNQSHGVRRAGAAALDLAYVAAGRLDGYWERGLNPWDVAAGALLVLEAGGKVSDYNLESFNIKSDRILATNGLVHEAISEVLLQVRNKQGITTR